MAMPTGKPPTLVASTGVSRWIPMSHTPTTAVDNDQQLNFSDIIHDEEHHDLSSLIQAGPQSETANNPTEAEHVPAEGGMAANTDSYDAGHEAMVDNLISKPEETT